MRITSSRAGWPQVSGNPARLVLPRFSGKPVNRIKHIQVGRGSRFRQWRRRWEMRLGLWGHKLNPVRLLQRAFTATIAASRRNMAQSALYEGNENRFHKMIFEQAAPGQQRDLAYRVRLAFQQAGVRPPENPLAFLAKEVATMVTWAEVAAQKREVVRRMVRQSGFSKAWEYPTSSHADALEQQFEEEYGQKPQQVIRMLAMPAPAKRAWPYLHVMLEGGSGPVNAGLNYKYSLTLVDALVKRVAQAGRPDQPQERHVNRERVYRAFDPENEGDFISNDRMRHFIFPRSQGFFSLLERGVDTFGVQIHNYMDRVGATSTQVIETVLDQLTELVALGLEERAWSRVQPTSPRVNRRAVLKDLFAQATQPYPDLMGTGHISRFTEEADKVEAARNAAKKQLVLMALDPDFIPQPQAKTTPVG